MTPKHNKFMIEITTDSDYDTESMYETMIKWVTSRSMNAYLKQEKHQCHITGLRIFKMLPERNQVVDQKLIKRYTRDE